MHRLHWGVHFRERLSFRCLFLLKRGESPHHQASSATEELSCCVWSGSQGLWKASLSDKISTRDNAVSCEFSVGSQICVFGRWTSQIRQEFKKLSLDFNFPKSLAQNITSKQHFFNITKWKTSRKTLNLEETAPCSWHVCMCVCGGNQKWVV